MAAIILRKIINIANFSHQPCVRPIHTTPLLCKITMGKYKRTKDRSKPLTYEQANQPVYIAHRKAWNSWNTSTLEGGRMRGEILVNDILIRRFLNGTFHNMIVSEIIVKRQHNIIRLAFIINITLHKTKIAFLIGYSEEMLGFIFQCPVKIEPHFIADRRSVIYQYV